MLHYCSFSFIYLSDFSSGFSVNVLTYLSHCFIIKRGCSVSEVIFNGCAGRIEGRFHQAVKKNAPIALVLAPHPKQGGTMNNRVTHTLFKTFAYKGFSVLKFNYRGVGNSEGVYDEGEGELSDAASALDWVQSMVPMSEKFWVAGYSFGALLSMQLLMRRPELEGFIAVSPPANHYDFNFLAPCPVSGKIIQGGRDAYVKHDVVEALVEKLRAQRGIEIDYSMMPNVGHLYSNHLDDVSQLASDYLDYRLTPVTRMAG